MRGPEDLHAALEQKLGEKAVDLTEWGLEDNKNNKDTEKDKKKQKKGEEAKLPSASPLASASPSPKIKIVYGGHRDSTIQKPFGT